MVRRRSTNYDSDIIRQQIETAGSEPKINRRWKPCFVVVLSRGRNAIKHVFGHMKDFGRIATCYLSAIYLAAVVSYRV